MSGDRWIDPEIDTIFGDDPALATLAHQVREARPAAPLDPRFQGQLRAQLMREAPAVLSPAPRPTLTRRIVAGRQPISWWRRPGPFAWGGAVLGATLVAAAVLTVVNTQLHDHEVTAMSPVAELHAINPDQVITVSFSQPMDHSAVVAGLHIQPATQVSTTWQGNNLVITPTHHLAGNTPYTVTIARSSARAANGSLAAADIHFAFGTAATPPPGPAVFQLQPHALGPVGPGAQLLLSSSGTVVVTASTGPRASPAPSPSPTAAGTPSASPTTSPTSSPSATPSPPTVSGVASPSPSPSLPASGSPALVALSSDGSATTLGSPADAVAMAPNGRDLLAAVPDGSRTSLMLSALDGRRASTLASVDAKVLAVGWLAADTAVVAEADRLLRVDVQGNVSALGPLPAGTTAVMIAVDGGHAFAGADGHDGSLLDLATLQSRPLAGSRTAAAFSGDGGTIAWVDQSGGPGKERLVTSPVGRDAVASVPIAHPGDHISDVALDASGARIAYVDHRQAGDARLVVATLPAGATLAQGPAAADPVFAARGNRIVFISGGSAQAASLPGSTGAGSSTSIADGADSALNAFVDAQVKGDASTLQTLSSPAANAAAGTPHGLSRAYVISAVSNHDGTVSATARLIVDPSSQHPLASFADETLTLAPSAGADSFVVTALQVSHLHDEPIGPHVVQVTPASENGKLVLHISFDSDLRQDSVAAAVHVASRTGRPFDATTTYDADTRTATVALNGEPTAVQLSIATSLVDVNGQPLATSFTTLAGS